MPIRRSDNPVGRWVVAMADALLAALYSPLAISNLSAHPHADQPGQLVFDGCFVGLSLVTPVILGATAIYLVLSVSDKRREMRRVALLLQHWSLGALILRSLSLPFLAFTIPNESGVASLDLFVGILHLLPATFAGAGAVYLHAIDAGG